MPLVISWSRWEGVTSKLLPDAAFTNHDEPEVTVATAPWVDRIKLGRPGN